MGESHMPGDEHIGEGNRWCIQFSRESDNVTERRNDVRYVI
jgi:hypothetical protein